MKLSSRNRLFVLLLICFLVNSNLSAQWILVNDTGGVPNSSAALEIQSNEQGILIPRMNLANRLAILNPAEGLLVYQTGVQPGFYYYNGASWDSLASRQTVNSIVNISNSQIDLSSSKNTTLRDVKGSGFGGGPFISGMWVTRELNDIAGDQSFISLLANSFTLDSGIYFIKASAPSVGTGLHQIRLYNQSLGQVEALGTSVNCVLATSTSDLMAIIEVNSSGNSFVIEHRCENSNLVDGLGNATNWGTNVYTQVEIQKLD